MPARSSSSIAASSSISPTASPRTVLAHPARHDRLCQPVPAHRAARFGARCRRRAAGVARRGRARRRATAPASCSPRLNLPERLWSLPPATFSGGEQQRVNIARGFITPHPVLLLDEPTASLDAKNREVVVEHDQQEEARGRGAARHLPRRRRARGGRRPDHRRHRISRPERSQHEQEAFGGAVRPRDGGGRELDARPLDGDLRALPRVGIACSATIPT